MKRESTDTKGNKFFFERNGKAYVQFYGDEEKIYIGEFNEEGHFVVAREKATNYMMHGMWPISSLVLNRIPEDKYVIFNTINGVYAIKKSEIAGTKSNPEVKMSIAYKYHYVHLVPQKIMRKAAFKKDSGINKHPDADKKKGKPYINGAGQLIMDENIDPKYKYWEGGQSLEETLIELRATKEIAQKYLMPWQVKAWPDKLSWREKKSVDDLTPEEKKEYDQACKEFWPEEDKQDNNALNNDLGW